MVGFFYVHPYYRWRWWKFVWQLPINMLHHVPEVPDVPDVPSGDKIVWHLPINIRGISRRGIRITFLNKTLTDIF